MRQDRRPYHLAGLGVVAVLAGPACAFAAPIRVIDGDTLTLGAERVRIANIDAPETGGKARCLAERRLADIATQTLRSLTASGKVELRREGRDRYGRTLARVSVGGVDVGEELIRRGVAVRWTGRRADWCASG